MSGFFGYAPVFLFCRLFAHCLGRIRLNLAPHSGHTVFVWVFSAIDDFIASRAAVILPYRSIISGAICPPSSNLCTVRLPISAVRVLVFFSSTRIFPWSFPFCAESSIVLTAVAIPALISPVSFIVLPPGNCFVLIIAGKCLRIIKALLFILPKTKMLP